MLDAHANEITTDMKIAAAKAIADTIEEEQLTPDFVIPHALNPHVAQEVAGAVKHHAKNGEKVLI